MNPMSLRVSGAVQVLLSPAKVYRAEKKATKQALRKAGAFVRQSARRNYLRRRKRVSKPGQGPSVHSKHPYATLRNIRFALDSKEREVIVGPLKFGRHSRRSLPVNNTVAGVLESGGPVVYTRKHRNGRTTKKVIRIAKRPFMKPAFRDELPKFAALWRGKIK